MLPFSTAPYHDKRSGHRLRFTPEGRGGGMVWTGDGWEKTGEWRRFLRGNDEVLEISYNYAREETFLLTVTAADEGCITAFRLTDGQAQVWEFAV